MGTFGTLGQLKRQGKLKPYKGPMPKGNVHDTVALAHHYPLHVAQAMEEYWRTKVKGCAECGCNARLHDRLGCREPDCSCRGLKQRRGRR